MHREVGKRKEDATYFEKHMSEGFRANFALQFDGYQGVNALQFPTAHNGCKRHLMLWHTLVLQGCQGIIKVAHEIALN
jgi:hypothetical protein